MIEGVVLGGSILIYLLIGWGASSTFKENAKYDEIRDLFNRNIDRIFVILFWPAEFGSAIALLSQFISGNINRMKWYNKTPEDRLLDVFNQILDKFDNIEKILHNFENKMGINE